MINEILEKEEKRLEEFCKFHNFTMAEIYSRHGCDDTDPNKFYVCAQINLIRSIRMQLNNSTDGR